MPGSGTSADPYICLVNEEFDPANSKVVRYYKIIGPLSVLTAFTALVASPECPAVHPESAGLNRQAPQIRESAEDYLHYEAIVEYTSVDVDPLVGFGVKLIPGQAISNVVRQKYAFQVLGAYAAPSQTAIDNGGAIGATKDDVEGIDEEDPGFAFGLEVRLPNGTLNLALMATVASFHKSVNSALWRGFAAGEVYFDNYEFDIEPDDHDLARLYFRVSPNATNIQIASPWGPIVVAGKRGWDYLDVSYVQQPDAQGVLRKVPHTATVLVTKRYTDFNGLV